MNNVILFVLLNLSIKIGYSAYIPDSSENSLNSTKNICECGQANSKIQKRVVDGQVAEVNEFPWRCLLLAETDEGQAVCGCSLISNEWVMTAGHCTKDVKIATIIFGAHDVKRLNGTLTRYSRKIIQHPDFVHTSFILLNDISLVKLNCPVPFSNTISPVCLPWKYAKSDFEGETVVTSGWGRQVQFIKGMSDKLQKLELIVMNTDDCIKSWEKVPGVFEGVICTHPHDKGTCAGASKGDSGGSIDWNKDERYYAIGITSVIEPSCEDYLPNAYIRVTDYLNWIQSVTGENFCKI